MTPKQATTGDALIFMTKCVFGTVALALIVAGLFFWWQAQQATARATIQARIDAAAADQVALYNGITAVYQNRLRACVQATGFDVDSVPDLPPGYVIDQPRQPRNLLADE